MLTPKPLARIATDDENERINPLHPRGTCAKLLWHINSSIQLTIPELQTRAQIRWERSSRYPANPGGVRKQSTSISHFGSRAGSGHHSFNLDHIFALNVQRGCVCSKDLSFPKKKTRKFSNHALSFHDRFVTAMIC